MRTKWIVIVLITVLFGFCVKNESSTQNPKIKIMVNANQPQLGEWDLEMQKIWESEKAGQHPMASVQNIGISEQGDVVVLDHKSFKIHVFNSSGTFITSFGKRGEGRVRLKS